MFSALRTGESRWSPPPSPTLRGPRFSAVSAVSAVSAARYLNLSLSNDLHRRRKTRLWALPGAVLWRPLRGESATARRQIRWVLNETLWNSGALRCGRPIVFRPAKGDFGPASRRWRNVKTCASGLCAAGVTRNRTMPRKEPQDRRSAQTLLTEVWEMRGWNCKLDRLEPCQ
jgi:hypothetical protein